MLHALVRVAGIALATLVALIAGVSMAAADLDGLPDASHVASVDFQHSTSSRTEIIAAMDAYADTHETDIVLVTSAPDDFLDERLAFRFGAAADDDASAIDFFSPTMHGSVAGSSALGTVSLDGVYALHASDARAEAFATWLRAELGADAALSRKSADVLLAHAMVTVGGWAPAGAAVLLLGATVIAWNVMRARARELSLLGGMRRRTVALTDLRTLLHALAFPAVGVSVAAVVVVAAIGFGRLLEYVVALAAFLAAACGVTVALAIAAGLATMPSVERIATRKPATGEAWMLSELLKVVCVVLVAATVPVTALMSSAAVASTLEGETWASLDDAVSIRVGLDDYPTQSEAAQFGALVRDESASGNVLFSLPLSSDRLQLIDDDGMAALEALGFDGMVMANSTYVEAVLPPATERAPVASMPTTAVLPAAVTRLLAPTFGLWVRDGATFDPPVSQVDGDASLPAFAGSDGSMERYDAPLVVVVDDLGVFRDDFLTSMLSTDNIAFSDAASVLAATQAVPLADMVLSVDRIADLGLYAAQTQQRNAQLAIAAVAVAVLALLVSTTVAAWIHALLRRRRWFVERTAGRRWAEIVARRMTWEAVSAAVLGVTMLVSLQLVAPQIELPAVIAAASSVALWGGSWLVHLWAAQRAVRGTVARRG